MFYFLLLHNHSILGAYICYSYGIYNISFYILLGEVRDMPVALHVSVLNPCMPSEVLRISIDVQTGSYMASVPSCGMFILLCS